MNGVLVGEWSVGRTGRHVFQYHPGWREHPRSRPLSLSLPFTADGRLEGEVVEHCFDNLLPDNDAIRKRLGMRFRTRGTDAFSLLQAIGRDCVGAVQLLPVDAPTPDIQRLDIDALDLGQVEALLAGLGSDAGAGAPNDEDDFRISIAGAQEKTALLKMDGRWYRPRQATPTTHILKLPIGVTPSRQLDLSLSPENEWLCARILRALGLPMASCEVVQFGARRALVVERFDRQWQTDPAWVLRLPQEDFCQVLGRSSADKYEGNGGPGMDDCLSVLKGGTRYEEDGRVFLLAQLGFWLLAAIDGHAKNFSVFLLPGGRYHLTPLYDVLSAWPILENGPHSLAYKKVKMAMAVRGGAPHYRLAEILPRHWQGVAQRSGIPGLWDAMRALVARVPQALATVRAELPAGFPSALAENIFAGTARHAARFEAHAAPAGDAQA
ncbi:type II toxin-antitoxin system HipA family toxin [Hydrogenophaga pseudoflava]|uniref:type II toxin-antitoxin system HipA family toxin n=1 Tax=Hydrogenophaga pseudoflava TaxID=47421 RepID=UPI0027E3CAE4|nr:type II toxin-antitoxin system HipA family toxin [Hydrogenophaga pseudoflava]MDQ7747467.1 type II toxin-antitoxin system HipA family toxin [Hydrogenophaga pseudoflava]